MHPAYDIYFVYFRPDSPSRVVKFAMTDMHKIEQGGIYMGDPMKMSPALGIPQAEKWYEFFTGRKKKFDTPKCGQFALYKLLMKKAIPFTEEDMKKSYRTQVEIPKPNNYCKEVSARDPYDTSQKLLRTDKVPMSAKNKERMKQYEKMKTIQDVLDKGILTLNDIKYDIKLGYIKKT
jgi:hypothetical protein